MSDTVVFLGDYVDRGPDSRGCIERIIDFERGARTRVIKLLGNHEEWLLRTFDDYSRHSWMFMGAFPTIESYSRVAATKIKSEIKKLGPKLILDHARLPYDLFFDAMPRKHIDFIKSLKIYHRSPDGVCVHGGLDPASGPPEEQKTEDLIWGTDEPMAWIQPREEYSLPSDCPGVTFFRVAVIFMRLASNLSIA